MKTSPLFSNIETGEAYYDDAKATYKGITIKTFILLLVTIIISGAVFFYLPQIMISGNLGSFLVVLFISSIVGFISVIVGRMSDKAAKIASFIYAICEGMVIGAISLIAELYVKGVVAIALGATLILFTIMLTLFATGVIRVGTKFRSFMYAFMITLIPVLIMTFVASIFITDVKTYLAILIFVEILYLAYGVFSLLLNFKEAQIVVDRGCSKASEWSVSLGLMVSLMYIFLEILRLILYITSMRRD